MFSEHSAGNEAVPTQEAVEISLSSEEDFKNLEDRLQSLIGPEGAAQLVFVLHSMAEEDFINHCKEATLEFGKRLAERFGDEESFFDIVPSADLYDLRSDKPLDKVGYLENYHSVALLEIKAPEKEPFSLAIDLTYGSISRKRKTEDGVLVMRFPGGKEQAPDRLQSHYGGRWKSDFKFNKRSNHFVFQDEKARPYFS